MSAAKPHPRSTPPPAPEAARPSVDAAARPGVKEAARPGVHEAGKPVAAHPYTRFIPREELGGFSTMSFGDLRGGEEPAFTPTGAPRRRASDHAPPPPDLPAQHAEQLKAARQQGYQDGYRDGMVALDGFKQSYAQQTTAQIGTLVANLTAALDGLQQDMAQGVAAIATELARRVVRHELAAEPERIARVATEAIDAMMLSAKHMVLRVHPDDLAFVQAGCAEQLAARGARVVADSAVTRGGCRVESDIGGVDATVEERWRQAIARIGATTPWQTSERGDV